jgi:sortase A
MTAVDTDLTTTSTATDSAPAPNRVTTGARNATRRRIGKISAVGLLCIVIAWALFALFEGPVARSWYTLRQHRLASSLATPTGDRAHGAAIGVLQIPNIDVNLVVAEGESVQQLRSGPVHREDTPLPGEVGNSVILGHHSAWGAPFADLDMLARGNYVVVQTRTNLGLTRNAVFKITSLRHASETDPSPFAPSKDRRLTIITGAGGSSNDRIVLTAVSGPVRKVLPAAAGTDANVPSSSGARNAQVLLAVVGLGAGLLLGVALRRRYHPAAVLAVVLPLALMGALGLLLAIDTTLPALR